MTATKIDVSTMTQEQLIQYVKDTHANHGRGRYPQAYHDALKAIPSEYHPAPKTKLVTPGVYTPKSTDYPAIPTNVETAKAVLSWWEGYHSGPGRPPKCVSAAKEILGTTGTKQVKERADRVRASKTGVQVRTIAEFMASLPVESSDVLKNDNGAWTFQSEDGTFKVDQTEAGVVFFQNDQPTTETDYMEALVSILPG